MADVKFKLNLPGLLEVMKSSEMQGALLEAGQAVASAAGEGYAAQVHTASFVAISNVYPDTEKAAHENFEQNTLMKAVSAVGLETTK